MLLVVSFDKLEQVLQADLGAPLVKIANPLISGLSKHYQISEISIVSGFE
jgi:hypothetical protein